MTTDESKVVMVTGVSSGFGQAIAAELQARGHRVFGTSRRASATAPSGCSLVTLDVDDEASVEAARPRLRYPAANAQQRTLVALRPLLPQRLFEYLVMDNYRIR